MRVLLIGAAWLVGLRAALVVLAAVLESSPLPEAVIGALIVDIGTGRAGVLWAEGDPARGVVLRLAARGAAVGAGVAGLALGASIVLGLATVAPASLHATQLIGFIPAAAVAVRDELLFRGLPLHFAARAGLPLWAAVAFGALASPSAFVAASSLSAAAVILAIANGALFGVLYAKTKSAWTAVGAHAAWTITTDVIARGGLFEARWSSGELASADAASGPPAYLAAALAVAASIAILLGSRLRSKAAR
jgi:membrane protease YdiL (CAAX protease family)